MLFYRSVVVVCKNMNATDVERLVPRLSLPGCNPKDSRKPQTPKYKGRCIELQNQRNKTAASAAIAIADSSCRGKNQAGCMYGYVVRFQGLTASKLPRRMV